jgi:hypothetical protein
MGRLRAMALHRRTGWYSRMNSALQHPHAFRQIFQAIACRGNPPNRLSPPVGHTSRSLGNPSGLLRLATDHCVPNLQCQDLQGGCQHLPVPQCWGTQPGYRHHLVRRLVLSRRCLRAQRRSLAPPRDHLLLVPHHLGRHPDPLDPHFCQARHCWGLQPGLLGSPRDPSRVDRHCLGTQWGCHSALIRRCWGLQTGLWGPPSRLDRRYLAMQRGFLHCLGHHSALVRRCWGLQTGSLGPPRERSRLDRRYLGIQWGF